MNRVFKVNSKLLWELVLDLLLKRSWNMRTFSKEAGLSHATIYNVCNNGQQNCL